MRTLLMPRRAPWHRLTVPLVLTDLVFLFVVAAAAAERRTRQETCNGWWD